MCIDDYASGDIEALNELMEREPYEPFRRIVENRYGVIHACLSGI